MLFCLVPSFLAWASASLPFLSCAWWRLAWLPISSRGFRSSGSLLCPFLPALSWISLPWLSFKCLTVIDNAHSNISGTQSWRSPRATFPDSVCNTFHWILRESLLAQVLQNWLLWFSWFLLTFRAGTTWVCTGILSTETLPFWWAIPCMNNALTLGQPHLNTQYSLLGQNPPGSHIPCHIPSWKIDKRHRRISAKPYSLNVKTVLNYRSISTMGWEGPTRITKSSP